MTPLPALPIAAIQVDSGSFFAIVAVSAIAAITVATVPKRFAPPVVVIELTMGILIGPEILGLAHSDDFIEFFANLRLGMLFFFTGSAMATTAIGTLIPILRDNGELKTRFGTHLLAAGGAGEFGPILLVTLVLSTTNPFREAAILLAFIALALVLALASVRYAWRGWPALERTFEASSQLAVRVTVVLVFGLVLLAGKLGLDILLGGFVAGMITRLALQGHELQVFESKLTAVGFGFFVPFFFVTSGIEFDLAALGSAEAIAKLFLFLGLFLVVRGVPAMVLYRRVLATRDRMALAFYCATELPLVVAITTIAIDDGKMKPSTAAGLVGAAMLSTLIFPFVGMALRKGATDADSAPEPPAPAGEVAPSTV